MTGGGAWCGVWEAPGRVPGADLGRSVSAPRDSGSGGGQCAPTRTPHLHELSSDGWA